MDETRETIGRLARSQHSLITHSQAVGAGLSEGRIRRRIRSGEWGVIRPAVYAIAAAAPSWLQAVCAATLSAGPEAWASHGTAAALWAFQGLEAGFIEVLAPLGHHIRLDGVRGHRSGALFTADLTRHRAIPVTTPERTLVDVSGRLSVAQLGRILDDGMRRRLIRLDRLGRCVGRLPRAPGRHSSKIHRLLMTRLPGYDPADSDLETKVLRLLANAGLPLPVQQHRVRIGGRTYRIDLAYPDFKLAIELDGWEFHRSRSAFDDDRTRANALVVAGWTILRFTSTSTEAEILASVRAALGLFAQSGVA